MGVGGSTGSLAETEPLLPNPGRMERLFNSLLPFCRQGLEGQLAAKALQKGSSAPDGHRLPPRCFPTRLCSAAGSKPTQSTTCAALGCTSVFGGPKSLCLLQPLSLPDLQFSLSLEPISVLGALPLSPSFTRLLASPSPSRRSG